MSRFATILFLVVTLAIGLGIVMPAPLFAQNAEANAWLAAQTAPADVNVDGAWTADNWGPILLHQPSGAREVSGTADNWEITGVVSGKQVFLAFSSAKKLAYTAQVSPAEDGSLRGVYVKYLLQPNSKGIPFVLRKAEGAAASTASDISQPAAGGSAEPARVVMYRDHYHNCPLFKPDIYVDGKLVAKLQNGRYFTVSMAPGKHLVGTSKVGKMGSQVIELNVAPATIHYLHFDLPSAWVCRVDIEEVNSAVAMTVISNTQPSNADRVMMPEIVSLAPIEK